MAAQPHRIRECDVDLRLARLVGDVVQVALRIGMAVVNRRRQHTFVDGRTHIIASTAPAAPKVWPIIDFVDETASSCACAPKTSLIAFVSARSPSGVEVPCALM